MLSHSSQTAAMIARRIVVGVMSEVASRRPNLEDWANLPTLRASGRRCEAEAHSWCYLLLNRYFVANPSPH